VQSTERGRVAMKKSSKKKGKKKGGGY